MFSQKVKQQLKLHALKMDKNFIEEPFIKTHAHQTKYSISFHKGVLIIHTKNNNEMRTKLLSFLLITLFTFSYAEARERIIKVSAEPKEAAIYIDNVFSGNGYGEFTCPKKKNTVVMIRIEADGYRTVNSRFYGGDKREALSFKLVPDGFMLGTTPSGAANKYFTIEVAPQYYSKNEDNSYDTKAAWKMLHQIILNYFDEIETTDFTSGFVQTPWKYSKFSMTEKQVRNRVTIRDISSNDMVAFQIKVSSEVGTSKFGKSSEYVEIDRIPKDFETLIQELQTRIGKLFNL